MKTCRVGRTGLKVSEVCLGTMTFGHQCDERTSFAILDKATEAGVTFLDTADVYPVPPTPETAGRTEEIIGKWLHGKRDRFVLATKCRMRVGHGPNDEGLSRRHILQAADNSLRRLRTDFIDLYQTHSPDPDTPPEETLRAFDDLVRQGKVRYIGSSTLPAWQVVEAQWTARYSGLHHFISCQEEYSLLARGMDRDMMPVLEAYGLGLIPFRPLADGLLTGKYRRGAPLPTGSRLGKMPRTAGRYMSDEIWSAVERLEGFAFERGHTLLELALNWLLQRPAVASVIAGATTPEQVEQNIRAAGWTLSEDDMQEIDRLTP